MMPKKTIKNFKANKEKEIRAEELIVSIYKLKIDLQGKGREASRIIMPMDYYKIIKKYHQVLGEIQGKMGDYITDDEIFGIPVYIDGIDGIKVE